MIKKQELTMPKTGLFFKVFVVVTLIVFIPVGYAQTNDAPAIIKNHSPLDPDFPDNIELEVPLGTTRIHALTNHYDRKEKRYIYANILETTLDNRGHILTQTIKDRRNPNEVTKLFKDYDDLGRLISEKRYFIENKDTLPQITKISYKGTNPLISKWETNTETFYEKFYFNTEGIVIKRETMSLENDASSIYRVETYDPIKKTGVSLWNDVDVKEEYVMTYEYNRVKKEQGLNKVDNLPEMEKTFDEHGNMTQLKRRYSDQSSLQPVTINKLYYNKNTWVVLFHELAQELDLAPNSSLTYRTITINGVQITPTKEQMDTVMNAIEFPKSKFGW